jgi:predicted nucleic acid-binding Zn ribbon protein
MMMPEQPPTSVLQQIPSCSSKAKVQIFRYNAIFKGSGLAEKQ